MPYSDHFGSLASRRRLSLPCRLGRKRPARMRTRRCAVRPVPAPWGMRWAAAPSVRVLSREREVVAGAKSERRAGRARDDEVEVVAQSVGNEGNAPVLVARCRWTAKQRVRRTLGGKRGLGRKRRGFRTPAGRARRKHQTLAGRASLHTPEGPVAQRPVQVGGNEAKSPRGHRVWGRGDSTPSRGWARTTGRGGQACAPASPHGAAHLGAPGKGRGRGRPRGGGLGGG